VNANYEILDGLPVYGPMYIPVTEDGEPYYSEGFVVRFFKSNGESWVANFQPGWTKFSAIYTLLENDNILVLACGKCYLMNVNETKPVGVFGVGFVKILETESHQYILQDVTDLTIVEPNGNHWGTERISWDGFKDINYENGIVSGLSFDPMYDKDEWVEFAYNIDTKILVGGSYPKYDQLKSKSWWQFWK
jgi:hypothetical protein